MLPLIELLLIVAVVLLFVTQILIPVLRGTELFPTFRKSVIENELKQAGKRLENVVGQERLQHTIEDIERREAKLKKD